MTTYLDLIWFTKLCELKEQGDQTIIHLIWFEHVCCIGISCGTVWCQKIEWIALWHIKVISIRVAWLFAVCHQQKVVIGCYGDGSSGGRGDGSSGGRDGGSSGGWQCWDVAMCHWPKLHVVGYAALMKDWADLILVISILLYLPFHSPKIMIIYELMLWAYATNLHLHIHCAWLHVHSRLWSGFFV